MTEVTLEAWNGWDVWNILLPVVLLFALFATVALIGYAVTKDPRAKATGANTATVFGLMTMAVLLIGAPVTAATRDSWDASMQINQLHELGYSNLEDWHEEYSYLASYHGELVIVKFLNKSDTTWLITRIDQ